MQVRKSNIYSFLFGLSVFLLAFGGAVKSIPGISELGNFLNILTIGILTFVALADKRPLRNSEILFLHLGFIFICIIYVFIGIKSISSEGYWKYFLKLVGNLYAAFLVIAFARKSDQKTFLNSVYFFAIFLVLLQWLKITPDSESYNYLTRPLLFGAALLLLWIDISYRNNRILNILLLILLILTMFILGGRGSLIFSLVIVFFLLLRRNAITALAVLFLGIIVFNNLLYEPLYNMNPLFFERMSRILNNIAEEPRYQLYVDAIDHIVKNPLGYGFYSHRELLGQPYIESLPLEILFNFGIVGFIMFAFIVGFILRKFSFRNDKSIYILAIISLYMFMNYSKGWSLSDGINSLLPLYLAIAKES